MSLNTCGRISNEELFWICVLPKLMTNLVSSLLPIRALIKHKNPKSVIFVLNPTKVNFYNCFILLTTSPSYFIVSSAPIFVYHTPSENSFSFLTFFSPLATAYRPSSLIPVENISKMKICRSGSEESVVLSRKRPLFFSIWVFATSSFRSVIWDCL